MKWINLKNAGLASDAICTVLLGTAILAAFMPYSVPRTNLPALLLVMIVSTFFAVLFSRKGRLSLPILLGFALLATLISLVFGKLDSIIDYFFSVIDWYSAGFPASFTYSKTASLLLIRFCMTIPIASLLLLFYRKLFLFWLIPPAALSIIIWLAVKESSLLWPVLYILLYVLFISLAKMRGIRAGRHLKEKESKSSIHHSITAIFIMPLIMVAALLFSPKADGDWQSGSLVRAIEDFSVLFKVGDKLSTLQGTFNLGFSGFMPLENRLGGDVKLNHNIVLHVTTDTPCRLTGAIYDSYDGERWTDSGASENYRYTSLLFSGYRSDAFGLDLPSRDIRKSKLFDAMTTEGTFEVYSKLFGNTLFHTGKMNNFTRVYPFEDYEINFNMQGEIILKDKYLYNMEYHYSTVFFDRAAENFNTNMLSLQKMVKKYSDKAYDDIADTYLQLPETLPENVRNTAEEITEGCETPYEKALAIENWLAQNCTYTLTPGDPPVGGDFVDYFLQTRQGYCVYYASSMAVLARCEGLPSRYVIGYALNREQFGSIKKKYVATNATAHAWTEIYFEGIGWVQFDPLFWNFEEAAVVDAPILIIEGDNVATPTVVPTVISTDTEDPGDSRNEAPVGFPVIALIAVIVILLYGLIRFYLLRSGSRLYFKWLSFRYPSQESRVNACYSKILRQLLYLGYPMAEDDTISSFSQRIDNHRRVERTAPAFETVIRMRFAQEIPSDTAIMNMCEYSSRLEKFMLFKWGALHYIIWRILFFR